MGTLGSFSEPPKLGREKTKAEPKQKAVKLDDAATDLMEYTRILHEAKMEHIKMKNQLMKERHAAYIMVH